MNLSRKRKLLSWLFVVAVVALAVALVMYALRQNISLFYTPTQLATASNSKTLRLGGMVVKGSVIRSKDLKVSFELTDYKNKITVRYKGILPDLFREGQGIVALGKMQKEGYFQAEQVLAKHDANYMPKELKSALKEVKSESNG